MGWFGHPKDKPQTKKFNNPKPLGCLATPNYKRLEPKKINNNNLRVILVVV
jgi:hypothetical protein